MRRRSFISLLETAIFLRMPLWGPETSKPALLPWGVPKLLAARAEYQRVVLSFAPVSRASSYRVEVRDSAGNRETISPVEVSNYSVQGLKNGSRYWFRVAAEGPGGTTPFSNELSATPTSEMDWQSLVEAFRGSNPTRSSCPFWMVHGNETESQLREFMRVIYRFGFEGVTLHPYDYKGFLEKNNWNSWRIITDEARKLGLTIWEQDDKDYPCGYAGGKVVEKNRDWARWEVTLAHQARHHGPAHLALSIKDVLPPHQRLVAVSACDSQGHFVDLTDSVREEQLSWDVPAGDWGFFVIGAWQPGIDAPKGYPDLVRGEVRGYIDPLSNEATSEFVKLVLEATSQAVGSEELGRTWKGFYIDEPGFYCSGMRFGETGVGFPWTPHFLPRFSRACGYDLRPLLSLFWVEHGSETASICYDYLNFISSEYASLFIAKRRHFAEGHGMQVNGHVVDELPYQLGRGGGTGSNFRSLEAFSMGGFDQIMDQWYTPEDDTYWRKPKMASSVSHYMETPLDEAMVEHFAATGWRTGLTEMKAMMDWTNCRGLNRIVPCGLDTQDPPVWEDQPEFWLHGRNPLAPYFHAYQVIANRETMMIRGGRHLAKVLLLDNAESHWAGPAEELWKCAKALSQAHFDYDMVSYGVFSDLSKCHIEGSRVRLGREEYEFIILPGADVDLRV